MRIPKNISSSFVFQKDQSDCGVACLLSIIQFHGARANLEDLRIKSGTSSEGTTLLGLAEAAYAVGFNAEGCEGTIELLAEETTPCIIHVVIENLQHYVVYYKSMIKENKLFLLIGDPARGLSWYKAGSLEECWSSGSCLLLSPAQNFKNEFAPQKQKLQWVKELLIDDLPLLLISIGVGIVVTSMGLTLSIFSQKLIDDILPNRDAHKLYTGLVLVVFLLIIKELLTLLRQRILLKQSRQFNSRITGLFFQRLMLLPFRFFQTRKIGDLTSRLNDTSRIQRVISQLVSNSVTDLLLILFSIGFIFFYSWHVGLFVCACAPVLFVIIRSRFKDIKRSQQQILSSYAAVESNYISTLEGIGTIKQLQQHSLFEDVNKSMYEVYQSSVVRLGHVQAGLNLYANLFSALFLATIIWYCSYSVWHGEISIGNMIAITSMCATLLPSVANLSLFIIPITEARIAFDRMFEFASMNNEQSIEVDDKSFSFQQMQVSGISFRYPGRSNVLDNLSFHLKRNEIIAIMGANGSGKTTLTQLLQKNYLISSGDILVNDNYSLSQVDIAAWRGIVGIVPQSIHIFNATVLENIAFGDAVSQPGAVLNFLKDYGFDVWIDRFPRGAMTLLGKEGQDLSGGQQQLIALARALYARPQLLLLDEATAAMDRSAEQFVLQLLQRLRTGMAIIFITHRLHVLKNFCDRIYIMEKGSLIAQGKHEELLTTDNLYSRYWNDLVQ